MVLHWALQGPLKGPCDFRDSERPFSPFLKNTFSKLSEHYGTRLLSLLYFTKAQGTLMDPQMDPKIDPAMLILEDPCRLKALQGPSKVQIDQSFFIDIKTTDKRKNTAWFEVN